jgi:hypothetical protein
MVKKMSLFSLQPFLSNFQNILNFLYNLIFHQVHLMNMYFHRKEHIFVVKKLEINSMTFYIHFDSFF